MESEIVSTPEADAKTRLEIYSDAYRLRLIEALATDYVAVKTLAGEEQFERLAHAFIETHPSTYYNVRWFGESFASFLLKAARDQPQLSQMAEFEWAMTLAFDAPDEPALTVEEMAGVQPEAWPEMTFTLHPSLQRRRLNFNVPEIWKAVDKGENLPTLKSNTTAWIIWRRDYKTYFRSLNEDESFALEGVASGANFADVCGGLTRWMDEDSVALHAAGLLKGWVNEALLRSVSVAA
jgi:hypothetical protein